jgi:hypothetical protein
MKPRLITNQMIQSVKYNISKKKYYIKKTNNYYANLGILLIIILFFYYLYYRYTNKNESLKKKKKMKQYFSNTLFNYYNQIKRKELIDILNAEPENNIFNEYTFKTPSLISMNNKDWVKKPLKY